MPKSSRSEQAQRVNAAVELIRQHGSLTQAAIALAGRYAISKRQAYRYVREANLVGEHVPIPEPKVAFTVKLPRDLIQAVRECAASTGQPLGKIVAQALEAFLVKERGRG
jgi:hypothetical protein